MRLWRNVGLLTTWVGVMLTGTACGAIHTQPGLTPPPVNQNAPTTGSVGEEPTGSDAASFSSSFLQARADTQQSDTQQSGQPTRGAPKNVLHADWGTFTKNTDGESAVQSVQPDLKTDNPGDVVYAPTLKPAGGPGGSCIEVVTAYKQGGAAVWAWDWCAAKPGPRAVRKMDSSFMSNYTAIVNGLSTYSVRDMRTNAANNTWLAQLYNYRTQSWDTLFTSSGRQNTFTSGWDMFEVYSTKPQAGNDAPVCSDLVRRVFFSSDIQILVNGTWHPVDATNSRTLGKEDSFDCGSLTFSGGSPNNHWTVGS